MTKKIRRWYTVLAGIPVSRRSDSLFVYSVHRRNILPLVWVSWNMHSIIHWFSTNGSLIAVLVTVCVAVLLVCCLGCSNCPSRDKDDLFRRHEL